MRAPVGALHHQAGRKRNFVHLRRFARFGAWLGRPAGRRKTILVTGSPRCMLAHINTSGQHIALWLAGPSPLGYGRDPGYPIHEGTFIGDIFASPPVAKFCGGRGFGSNVVAGRIGAGQIDTPRTRLSPTSARQRPLRRHMRDEPERRWLLELRHARQPHHGLATIRFLT